MLTHIISECNKLGQSSKVSRHIKAKLAHIGLPSPDQKSDQPDLHNVPIAKCHPQF